MKPLQFRFVPLAFLFCASAASFSQTRAATALDSLPVIKHIDQVAISPDGSQVACIADGHLSLIRLSDGTSRVILDMEKMSAREVTWSPDSRQVAWLEDLPGDIPSSQLWTASADGNGAAKLVDLRGYAQTPRYSPDATQLAVLYMEGVPRAAGPLQPMTPLAGVVGDKVYEQRIALADLATKKLEQVTPDDVYIYEYDWTPDSKGWAAIAAHGSGDSNWWIARLYAVSALNGRMQEVYKPNWQIAAPRVSPDGKFVAFIEGLMSDAGLTGGDIYVVSLAGGAPRNLTPNIKASPSSVTWTGSDRLAVLANVDGNSGYATIPLTGTAAGASWKGWTGGETIGTSSDVWVPDASLARDGTVSAVVRQSATTPPEIWAGKMGEWKQITHLNQDVQSSWGESRNVHWMNGNARVQGWLALPKAYDPAKKYPMIVSVHGGPSYACTSKWKAGSMGDTTAASLLGWFVLCPNPRGSYGQGEGFTQGNVKDFGGGDFRDIMAGVDAMIQQFPIDSKKIGIWGHSYGGYMTMWAETQTTRFSAAVAGAGVSDLQSYYGLNDIDEWMIPFFGASVYDDPAVYQKSDPMHFVKNVKTPTLILVGDRDGEVPMAQSIEWYHALQALKVPTQFVVYPNEGHIFFKPADARDYTVRMLDWFEETFSKEK